MVILVSACQAFQQPFSLLGSKMMTAAGQLKSSHTIDKQAIHLMNRQYQDKLTSLTATASAEEVSNGSNASNPSAAAAALIDQEFVHPSVPMIGLVRGMTVNDVGDFVPKINLSSDHGLLSIDALTANIKAAAIADGYNLTSLTALFDTKETWLKAAKPAWGREQLKQELQGIIQGSGTFSCVLGGKNTGKSFLLRELRKEKNVLVLDMLMEPDIKMAFFNALAYCGNGDLLWEAMESIKRRAGATAKEGWVTSSAVNINVAMNKLSKDLSNPKTADAVADKLLHVLRENKDRISMEQTILDMAKALDHFTIIVDEANIAFNRNAADVRFSKTALAMFTGIIKFRLVSAFCVLIHPLPDPVSDQSG